MGSMADPHIKDNTPMFAAIYDPVIDLIPAIGSSATVVYIILKRMAGSKKSCFPSYTTLATKTGLSRPTVITAIEKLIEHGLVTRVTRQRADGGDASNSYVIENPMALPPSKENRTGVGKDSLPKVDKVEGDNPSGVITEKIPKDSRPYEVYQWFAKIVGFPPLTRPSGKDMAAAKQLVAYGLTEQEFNTFYAWLVRDPFWYEKGVNLNIMASNYGKFKSAKTTVAPKIKDV